jgi:hypothetical protein
VALSPDQFFRENGGELTANHFKPDEDPEEVVQGYIDEADDKVAAADAALRDGIAKNWVYYRAFQGTYAWVIMEPTQVSVNEGGAANFLDPEGLLRIALAYKEQFDTALAFALETPAARPFGPTLNKYIW